MSENKSAIINSAQFREHFFDGVGPAELEWFYVVANPNGDGTTQLVSAKDVPPPADTFTVSFHNWEGATSFIKVEPPKAGDVGGRNVFADDGTVIGYETWTWGDMGNGDTE
jgi:hypothetical protein